MVDLNQWNGGYIATFECEINRHGPNGANIDFNYTGIGSTDLSWMLSWIGDVEEGYLGANGDYVLRTTGKGHQPFLTQGQLIQFQSLINGATYADVDFSVDCATH